MTATVERLRNLRKDLLQITQAEFSGTIGISRSNLANIEKGNSGLSPRVVRDICREFSVRREWLLNGEEPVFDSEARDKNSGIEALFRQLSANNQKAIENQIELMLREQKNLTAAFTGSEASGGESLSGEEIRLLKELLAEKKSLGRRG